MVDEYEDPADDPVLNPWAEEYAFPMVYPVFGPGEQPFGMAFITANEWWLWKPWDENPPHHVFPKEAKNWRAPLTSRSNWVMERMYHLFGGDGGMSCEILRYGEITDSRSEGVRP